MLQDLTYIITTKLQQSVDDLAVYANQWRIGLNAGRTSKLLFQHSTQYIPDWHITLHGKAILSVTFAKFLGITFDTTSFTKHFHGITNVARHHLKLLSLSTYTHRPSPSTTIRLFNIYIHTILEYGSQSLKIRPMGEATNATDNKKHWTYRTH